jgi:hypothetical protein
MKNFNLDDKFGTIALVIALIILFVTIFQKCNKNDVQIIYKENPKLIEINSKLESEVQKLQSEICDHKKNIEKLTETKEQQKKQLNKLTQKLESEIVENIEKTQDSTLILYIYEVRANQNDLINTYETIFEEKDSIIQKQEKVIQSYVIANEKLSNEIEKLHAEKNELLINEMAYKDQIKKRNKIITAGCAIVAAGITTAILINR